MYKVLDTVMEYSFFYMKVKEGDLLIILDLFLHRYFGISFCKAI